MDGGREIWLKCVNKGTSCVNGGRRELKVWAWFSPERFARKPRPRGRRVCSKMTVSARAMMFDNPANYIKFGQGHVFAASAAGKGGVETKLGA